MAGNGQDPMSMATLFPGMDGLPFRLQPGQQFPMRKEDDPDYMQPQPVADAHVKVFNLDKKEDVKEYASIWDKAAKGLVIISAEERHWSDEIQNFKVFLRWGEVYLEMPKHKPGSSSYGQDIR